MMKFRQPISLIVLLLVIIAPLSSIHAQGNNPQQCQPFIHRAYSRLGMNCSRLEANAVCYGHEDVTGMIIDGETEPQGFFSAPGYRGELTPIARITGSPFDLDTEIWGLSKFSVQVYTADIENDDLATVDDNLRGVTYIPVGDIEIENALMPQNDEDGNLIVDAETPGPWQVFFLRNGTAIPSCTQAPPPLLLVQGADDADTVITVNGAKIKLMAGETRNPLPTTVVLQVLYPGDSMRLVVLSGLATLNPDSSSPTLIPPGYWTIACLDEPQDRGLDSQKNDRIVSCGWSEPALITDAMFNQLDGLQGLPGNVLKKPVIVPIILHPSLAAGGGIRLFFSDPDLLALAREACDNNQLPPGICRLLFE
jgi:hypothetical protein